MVNPPDFTARHPLLFHVTDRAALPSIRRHGLLSAAALCDLFEIDVARRSTLIDANRDRYETLEHPAHGTAVLRRQIMRDPVMATRLTPGLSPTDWRRYINSLVFFVVDEARAIGLRDYDRYRDQVILSCDTQAIEAAGVALMTCRYNNGMVDRSSPSRRRLRAQADYVPVAHFVGGRVAEVAATAVPAHVAFAVCDSST